MNKILIYVLIACLFATSAAWGRIGGGDITFHVTGARDVVYSHEAHVSKAELKCSDCHYRIFSMATLQQQATMADMQNGRSCGACHNGQRAFAVTANCTKCHK